MTNPFLAREIMRVLQAHRGRENAMPRRDLLERLRLFRPELTDRTMRDLYSTLPCCSSPDGLFIPRTPEEVQAFKDYVTKAWGPIVASRRVGTIVAYYPALRIETAHQGELPGMS